MMKRIERGPVWDEIHRLQDELATALDQIEKPMDSEFFAPSTIEWMRYHEHRLAVARPYEHAIGLLMRQAYMVIVVDELIEGFRATLR